MIKKFASLAVALMLIACGPAPVSMPRSFAQNIAEAPTDLPRADPRVSHFMEKNSMLFAAAKLTGVVSGTNLLWSAPSVATQKPNLPGVWLYTHPVEYMLGQIVNQENLLKPSFLNSMEAVGIQGLFILPLFESDRGENLWLGRATRLAPDLLFGTEDGYFQLLEAAEKKGIVLGGLGIGSATGLGPDFYLALRGVGDYQGQFSMVEVPQKLWELLPKVLAEKTNNPDVGVPLTEKDVEALVEVGLLPPAFSRDTDPLAPELETGGWAASGEILGQDGNPHRWVYRYAGDPARPVFQWDDPSAAAKRVQSASFVQQVGLWRQNLVGLSVEPFWGLDASPAGQSFTPEPALSALSEQSREVRRYGGASMLVDAFPAQALPALLAQGVDFVRSPVQISKNVDTAAMTKALQGLDEHKVPLARMWNLVEVNALPAMTGEVEDARVYFGAVMPGLFVAPAGHLAASLSGGNTYAAHMRKIVLLREKLGLDAANAAFGTDTLLTWRKTEDPAVLAYSYPLPDGKTLLVTGNFSGEEKTVAVNAPSRVQCRDMLQEKHLMTEENRITLKFLPWQCRILLIGTR